MESDKIKNPNVYKHSGGGEGGIAQYTSLQSTYFTKASKTAGFFLSPTYSPIMALLSQGLSTKKLATSSANSAEEEAEMMPLSWRKLIPSLGLLLNCSVAANIT